MAERNLFLNDHWLSTIATPSTDVQQNYFPLVDNSELAASLNDFSACLNATVVEPTVEFDGWEAIVIPTVDRQDWLWMLYHDDIGYWAFAGFSGAEHAIQSADDGKTWTPLATPLAGNFWWQPIYVPSAGLIVVPTDEGGGTNYITSDDQGATWVEHTTGLDELTMKGIAYSPELGQYVAWSWDGIPISSTDLITWTAGTMVDFIDFFETMESVVWAPHLMLWCGINFWGQVITSTDGIVWDLNVLGGGTWDSAFQYMTWSDPLRLFVAQGEHHETFTQPNMFITSPDAVNWTQRPLTDSGIMLVQHQEGFSPTFLPAIQVIWSDSTYKFYALTKTGIIPGSAVTPAIFLMTSTDGFIWTIDKTVPNTHDLSYPVLGSQAYVGIAVKDENSIVLLSRAMIIRKIP